MILLDGMPVTPTIFPDKTSQVWKLDPKLLNRYSAKVTWTFEHEGEFMQLAQLKELLDASDISATLELTYLPYGRQDKEVSNGATFALVTFANLLNHLEFNKVTILDPHSTVALDLIDCSEAVYPDNEIAEVLSNSKVNLVCYPDKGALTKYVFVYDHVIGGNFIYGEKVRNQLTGSITNYELKGDCKEKHVLIVDDICDGGATFKILAKVLLDQGAASVSLFVTHGIFSRGLETLHESGIKEIYTAKGNVRNFK